MTIFNILLYSTIGEINHLQQKSESLSRDLKKHMKDSASALTEFEKALVRKSEECNVSDFLIKT